MGPRDWRTSAACRDHDPELFFPVGDGPVAKRQTSRAKAVCAHCPVVADCLLAATRSDHGVWGGMSEAERRSVRRRMMAGRDA